MKKILFRCILGVFGLLIITLLLTVFAFYISPKSGAMLIRYMFNSEVKIGDHKSFDKVKSNVEVTLNHHYNSKFKDNTYDLYLPKNNIQPVPVLIWVHGGVT